MPSAAQPQQDLPQGCYLDNFLPLLGFVEETYGDILGPKERALLEELRSLPADARRLYVRLRR